MTLKSALQDVRETTLAAVSGRLGKLLYLGSLRREHGGYHHWGMMQLYGTEAAERALKTAHGEVLSEVLRSPLASMSEDLEETSRAKGIPPESCVEEMRGQYNHLLPGQNQDSPAALHLNSLLTALFHLEKAQGRATRLAS